MMNLQEMKAMLKNKHGFILDGETERDLYYNLEILIEHEIQQWKKLQDQCENVILEHFNLLSKKKDPEFYGFKPTTTTPKNKDYVHY